MIVMKGRHLAAFLIAAFAASNAYGVVVDLSYGSFDVKAKESDDNPTSTDNDVGTTKDMGLHFLIPLMKNNAIALGAFGSQRTFSLKNDNGFEGLKYTGMIYGPEVRFTWDVAPVKPYLQGRYVIGQYKLEGEFEYGATYGFEFNEKTQGYMAGLGIDIPLGPKLGLSLEYGVGEETLKLKSSHYSVNGVDLPDSEEESDNNSSTYKYSGLSLGLGLRF